jgi:hypothetical protein
MRGVQDKKKKKSKLKLNLHGTYMEPIDFPSKYERDASNIIVMLCKRTETGGSLFATCFQIGTGGY